MILRYRKHNRVSMMAVFHRAAPTSGSAALSHLGGFLARLTVQAAYPPALQQLVVSGVSLHLLPLERGTVAGFQTGFLRRGFELGWSFDGLHWLHILVCLELSPKSD